MNMSDCPAGTLSSARKGNASNRVRSNHCHPVCGPFFFKNIPDILRSHDPYPFAPGV
jgi:hypothetical protein